MLAALYQGLGSTRRWILETCKFLLANRNYFGPGKGCHRLLVLQQAYSLYKAKDYPGAEKCFADFLATTSKPKVAYFYGKCLLEQKRFCEAEDSLKEAVTSFPDQPVFLNALGQSYFGQERYEEALIYFDRALALRPSACRLHLNVGRTLVLLKQYDEAESVLRRSLDKFPEFADAFYWLAETLYFKGLLEESLTCYNKAIEFNPDSIRYLGGKAAVLMKQQRWADAEVTLRLILDRNPTKRCTYENILGRALREQDRFEEAIPYYESSIRQNPQSYSCALGLGWCLRKLYRFEESNQFLRIAEGLKDWKSED